MEETGRRRFLWNSALFTAGHVLTSGGFLTYFASEFGAGAVPMAWLLTLSELAATAGVFSQSMIRAVGTRAVWRIASVASLAGLACIPSLAVLGARPDAALGLLLASVAIASAARGIAFVALLSSIASAVPATSRGRFFAARNIWHLAVMLALPAGVGFVRDWAKAWHSPAILRLVYTVTFTSGLLLLIAATAVLWRLPDAAANRSGAAGPGAWQVLKHPPLRRVILFHWWHAFASGLTQAAFFQFRIGPLAIGLGTFYLLEGLMRLVQIPTSALAGSLGDRFGHRRVLAGGVLVAGSSLLCWILASREQWWWIWLAYALFGGWAAVNVAGPNLVLDSSPRDETATAIALSQNVSGLLAGLAGLLGGYWLDHLLKTTPTLASLSPYQVLFAVSFVGRMSSLVWLVNNGRKLNGSYRERMGASPRF